MIEFVAIGLSVLSLGLSWLIKRPVKCVTVDVVPQEVNINEASKDVQKVQP